MRNIAIILLIAFLYFCGCRSLPGEKEAEKINPRTDTRVVDENTNIHYTGRFCSECHEKTPVEGGDPFLKFNGDYQLLCRCHHGMSPGYCHPLDIVQASVEKIKISDGFPRKDGQFTCNTCHDVYRQCQKRLFERQSLRGAPYPRKTDFCYQCHDRTDYQKLNAHHQIAANGELNTRMCLYCHAKKPDEKNATYKEVTFIGDIKTLCRRCHQINGNHSGNFDHTAVKPSAEALKRMDAMKAQYDIILPLTKDGKMTCITCHNPHQKGVIAADKPSAKGADSKFRHRLPGKLCIACHQM